MDLSLGPVVAGVADVVAGVVAQLRVFEGRELGSLSDAELVELQGEPDPLPWTPDLRR